MKNIILRLSQFSSLVMLACGLQSCAVTPQVPAEKPKLAVEFPTITAQMSLPEAKVLWKRSDATLNQTSGMSLLDAVKTWQKALASNQFPPVTTLKAHYGARSFLIGKEYPIPDWVYTESGKPVPASQSIAKPAVRGGRAEFEKELEKIQREGGGRTEMSITYPDGTRRDFPSR